MWNRTKNIINIITNKLSQKWELDNEKMEVLEGTKYIVNVPCGDLMRGIAYILNLVVAYLQLLLDYYCRLWKFLYDF